MENSLYIDMKRRKSMGIKMEKAIYQGKEIKISEFQMYMKGSLYCVYCNTPITYVSGHMRKIGNRDVHIQPYFRLVNENNPHTMWCDYTTSNAIHNIFADVSDDSVASITNNKYIVRLHIITDNMERKNRVNLPEEIKQSRQNQPTKKYIKNGEQPVFLQTLKKIVRLKEALDSDEELKNLVTLQFYNEYKEIYDEIKWKDFYADYDLKRYAYIYKLIENKKAYHPICFSGEIKEVNYIRDKSFYVIKFYSLKQREGEYLSFSILTRNKEVFDYANGLINKKVVVYGCRHFIGETNISVRENRNIKYNNFGTKINVKTQIFTLD